MEKLTAAVRRVYASVFNPDALFYRRRMGLLETDERMAVLIQEVQGSVYHDAFFPTLAGVAFSYSPIVWDSRLRKEEGFCRLVMGLGTRAVARVAEDYPRLVMLSHPRCGRKTPPPTSGGIRKRQWTWWICVRGNWLPGRRRGCLGADFPGLQWLASVDRGDTVMPVFSLGPELAPERMIVTMDNFLKQVGFCRAAQGSAVDAGPGIRRPGGCGIRRHARSGI